jgi:8-oxo-dGTP pyrophosphatase MutT (NUDIX family)
MAKQKNSKGPADDEWKILETHYPYRDEWLALRSEKVQLPDETILQAYHTIEFPDWVNVIALTPDLDIILAEQYRHPVRKLMVEFPAGAVDDGEEPLAAIKRELLEETGYASDEWHLLGSCDANPARQTNHLHSYLALRAYKIGKQSLGHGEFIRTHLVPWGEFRARIDSGDSDLPAMHFACLVWLESLAKNSSDPTIRQLAGVRSGCAGRSG